MTSVLSELNQRFNPALPDYHAAPVILGRGSGLNPGEKYRVIPEGMLISADFKPEIEEYDQIGTAIVIGLHLVAKFAFLDWYLYGEQLYGEEFYQCDTIEKARAIGIDISDASFDQMLSTARRLPPSERVTDVPGVEFEHNRQMANVKDPVKRRQIADRVREKKPTVQELRAEVKRANRAAGEAEPAVPIPFKLSLSAPASEPGESAADWEDREYSRLSAKLREALHAHAAANPGDEIVTTAKAQSRAEAAKARSRRSRVPDREFNKFNKRYKDYKTRRNQTR